MRPWAGLRAQTVDAAIAEALGLSPPRGVMVLELHPESPFAAAGLEPGDIVLLVGGRAVDGPQDMDCRLTALGPGTVTEVHYWRDGAVRAARVRLDPPAGGEVRPFAMPAGPALMAQLRPGDIIDRVNGMPVETATDLAALVSAANGGLTIEFTRNGQKAVIGFR